MTHVFDYLKVLEEEYRKLLPMKSADQKRFDEKMRLEFNYNSNHLEGNTLTYFETKALIIKDIAPAGNKSYQELEEIKGHDVAYELIKEWASDSEKVLTEKDIKELNRVILVKPFWKDAITPDGQKTRRLIKVGDYKELPNSVRLDNGEIFEYASPQEVPMQMGDLMDWLREGFEKQMLPIELAAMFHYRFVRIHPFDDGNGRLSRLLANYVLLKHSLPPVVVKTDDKKGYLNALRLADAGDQNSFVEYMGKELKWSLEKAILAAKGESLEDQDDVDKEIEVLKKVVLGKAKRELVKRSDEIIYDLYVHGFHELFQRFEEGLSSFYDLFVEVEKRTCIQGGWTPSQRYDYLVKLLNNWAAVHLGENDDVHNEVEGSWGSFSANISMNGFKSDHLEPFGQSESIDIVFKEFQYSIRYGRNPLREIKKYYSEKITEEEIEEIVGTSKRDLLEIIKERAGYTQ